jgi:hypothetical protein
MVRRAAARARRVVLLAVAAVCLSLPLAAEWPATESIDLDAVYRIKDEGLQRSKVMETASYLTDVYGPRLTGSPNFREAAAWAQKTMREWGLARVHAESWPFGRSWQNQRFVALALAPQAYPLLGAPVAWTPGTNGPVTAEAVLAVIQSEHDFETWHGRLRGKFVLSTPVRPVPARFEPLGRRLTDSDLADLSKQPLGRGRGAPPPGGQSSPLEFAKKRAQFFIDEGVGAVILASQGGDGGTFFAQSAPEVSRDRNGLPVPPGVVLAIEHYGRIARTLDKQIPVTLQFDIDNRFDDADPNGINIVAEIAGTDKADELVMLGAHFDSWQAGTGATDNAAGAAVMMEALRILKTTGLKLRRTVRLALWGGEEEGFLGSRAYVREHFANPETMELKSDHATFSVYFNLDNGTGAIRGIYLQGNEPVAPIFQGWMEPFKNLGMTTTAIRSVGGTDHLSFDAVGLPGFQFIQDPVEYDSRTHHSNQDVYERLQPDDLMRNAVIVASFALGAANRADRLPRKPLPKPQPR